MKKIYFFLMMLFVVNGICGQLPILYYDFENNTTRTTFENLVEQAINSGSGALTRAGNTTTISGVGGAGIFNGGAAAGQAATGSSWSIATTDPGSAGTDYYQFLVNTNGFSGVLISFDNQASATGPARVGVLYSTDGLTFTATSTVLTGNAVFSTASFDLSSIPAIDNQSSVTIRLYAFAGSASDRTGRSAFGSGGTFRIDNLAVSASTEIASKTLLNYPAIGLSVRSGTAFTPTYNSFSINNNTTATCVSTIALSTTLSIASGSTLADGGNTITIAGDITGTGTHSGAGNITMTGTGKNLSGISVGNLNINSGSSITLTGVATVNGNFIIGIGANFNLNGNTLTVNGNMSNGGSFTPNSGTVDFAGTSGTQTLTTGGTGAGKTFYVLTHSGASTLQLSANGLRVTNNFTNNAGPFTGNGLNVNVGGDLSVNGTYSSGGGTLTFDGSTNQNWSGAVGNDYGNAVINKSSGNAALNSNVQINNLTLSSGLVILGANNLTAGGTVTGGSSTSYIKTDGAGVFTVNAISAGPVSMPVGNSTYNPLSFTNGNGLNWSVRVEDALNNVVVPFNTNLAVNRTWHISPSAPVVIGPDVTFNFDDADDNQLTNPVAYSANSDRNAQVWHYTGANWIAASGYLNMTPSEGPQSLTLSGFTYFSPFAIAKSAGPLPVSLPSFSGYKDGSRNQLRWTTGSEQNNNGFEVQRSTDGINYTAIGFVNSLAAGGNSTVQLNYAFTDNNVTGSRQYYRLRQVDFDNHSKLSNIVLIKGDKPLTLTIDGLFPNPASSLVNVLIAAPGKDKVILVVTDVAGRTVAQQSVSVETGSNTVPVDISRLSNGTYMVKLVCPDCNLDESAVGKFVKQ